MERLPRLKVPWRWPLINVVLIAVVTVALVEFVYPHLPDPMPTHFNAAGDADGFREKSLGGFLGTILVGPVIFVVALVGALAILPEMANEEVRKAEENPRDDDPHRAHRIWAQNAAVMSSLGWFLTAFNASILLLLASSYLPSLGRSGTSLALLGMVASLVGFAVAHGRRTRAIEEKYPPPAEERGKKWGIFHNDPDDPRVLVPTSSSGMNYTFNVGVTGGKVAAALTVGVPVLIVLALALASL